MKKIRKRIIDLLFIALFFSFGQSVFAGDYADTGYPSAKFASITLAANATGSIEMQHNVMRFSLFTDGSPFEMTWNTATSTVYTASQPTQWEGYNGTDSLLIQPQSIGKNTFLWLKNGATLQKIRIKSYGR